MAADSGSPARNETIRKSGRSPAARWSTALLLGVALAGPLHVALAGAAPSSIVPTTASAAPRTIDVEIRVIGTQSDVSSLRQAFAGARLGAARLHWLRAEHFDSAEVLDIPHGVVASTESRTIRCWLDLRDHAVVHLYFADPRSDRFLARDLELEGEWGSFEVESVAQVVELSVMALVSDTEAGITRMEAQRLLEARQPALPRPEPQRPATEPHVSPATARVGFELVGSYALRTYSPEVPSVMGPSIGVARTSRTSERGTRLELQLTYEIPRSFRADVGGASLSAWTGRCRFEHVLPLGREARLWVGGSVALGVDIVSVQPTTGSAVGEYQLAHARSDSAFVLTPGATWIAELSGHVAVRLLVALDITPRPIAHTIEANGAPITLTRAAYVRPAALIGVIFR